MTFVRDAISGVKRGRSHRAEIQRNLDLIADMERKAARITYGPWGRCFDMGAGNLLVIRNDQPAGSSIHHLMAILPITPEDAEDHYGWSSDA